MYYFCNSVTVPRKIDFKIMAPFSPIFTRFTPVFYSILGPFLSHFCSIFSPIGIYGIINMSKNFFQDETFSPFLPLLLLRRGSGWGPSRICKTRLINNFESFNIIFQIFSYSWSMVVHLLVNVKTVELFIVTPIY